jgi:hypothetical protein
MDYLKPSSRPWISAAADKVLFAMGALVLLQLFVSSRESVALVEIAAVLALLMSVLSLLLRNGRTLALGLTALGLNFVFMH